MKGLKTVYICTECEFKTAKWMGKCPNCGAWNSFTEDVEEAPSNAPQTSKRVHMTPSGENHATGFLELVVPDYMRQNTGLGELDRVLGGGLVHGSVVLLSGEPGIGKSTLLMQICDALGETRRVLYVSGEESGGQLKLRAKRLGVRGKTLFILTETNMENILKEIDRIKPEVVIVDSIQTVYSTAVNSTPGSVSQVRECSASLMRLAKTHGVTTFIIGHVTKDGNLAGPRVLEHIVDTVLFFEGERTADFRVLRAIKNRFGATSEIGLFEMRDSGLADVPDASKLFLPDKAEEIGSVIVPTVEGTRPLLVEIQALVAPTPFMPPRRTSDSVDVKRIQLLLAVLEKRLHLSIGPCDVYVKTTWNTTNI